MQPEQTSLFDFGQRVRTTVDKPYCYAPSGSFGVVVYPLDTWGDIGVLLDGDSSGGIHAFGAEQLVLISDAPMWLAAHL